MKYAHTIKRITPRVGTALAGYVREPTSHGIYDDLYLQALLLDDEKNGRLILFSADLIGFDTEFANRMRRWIARQDAALSVASIVFSASHTHCGPATSRFAGPCGGYDDEYILFLEQCIKDCVGELLNSPMKKGSLYCGSGQCSLAMNRRLIVKDRKGRIKDVLLKPNPGGSVDHSLGVMQIRGKGEEIVVFNYACHPTTRDGYMISGDYPAAAARYLRASGGAKREAMFMLGAAGDLRVPCTSDHGSAFVGGDSDKVVEYGNMVAKAVERVIKTKLRRLRPSFASNRVRFIVPFGSQQPVGMVDRQAYQKLVRYRHRNEPRDGVPLDWTVWRLARDSVLIAIPGEICHMTGKAAKKMSGVECPLFLGYANGLPCYIPTDRILEEGGYEANRSMTGYGQPYLFKSGIDDILCAKLALALEGLG
jgi:hypothetical protein